MSHGPREKHLASCPVHVTLKVRSGIPSLRGKHLARTIGRWFREHLGRRKDFQVVVFSIQSNHLHLIVEAGSSKALIHGLQGLGSSLARTVNRHLGRRGPLFLDRYHKHTLRTPQEVRRALVYVLQNHAHHGGTPGIDPWSSAPWFPHFVGYSAIATDSPVAAPRTWKLKYGFLEHGGPLDPREASR
jgi:REP element-mobilizing transposase RayT